jgi:type IV pilus biogenesis protein CpaD/CtpE
MIIFDSVIAADRDHLIAEGEDERHPIHVIDLSESLDIAITQPRIRGEEAEVLRLRRDSIVKSDEPLRIGRPDGTQVGHTAVRKQHISFPLPWVSGRVGINIPRSLAHGHGQKPIGRERRVARADDWRSDERTPRSPD